MTSCLAWSCTIGTLEQDGDTTPAAVFYALAPEGSPHPSLKERQRTDRSRCGSRRGPRRRWQQQGRRRRVGGGFRSRRSCGSFLEWRSFAIGRSKTW